MLRTVGRYEILEKLGQGATGIVFKARDPDDGRIVAVKTMHPDISHDSEMRQRLAREVETAGRLQHPNIVTIQGWGEEGGIPFIQMEFVDGIDLRQRLRSDVPLTPAHRLDILKQVALGLAHAHSVGVVHRDVKPANVRLSSDGTAKLMDFGIARVASSQLTRTGTVLGSINYMAPEQVEGQRVDLRADVFSFGVLAYELFVGRVPFKGRNLPETMKNVLEAKPPAIAPADVQPFPGLVDVIHKCLRRTPEERFQSFDEILRALSSLAKDRPSGVRLPARILPVTLVLTAVAGVFTVKSFNQNADEVATDFAKLLAEGQAHLSAGRVDEALQQFQAAVAIKPGDREALAALAVARQRDNEARRAEVLVQQGERLLTQGRYDEAIKSLERAVFLAPERRDARTLLESARGRTE